MSRKRAFRLPQCASPSMPRRWGLVSCSEPSRILPRARPRPSTPRCLRAERRRSRSVQPLFPARRRDRRPALRRRDSGWCRHPAVRRCCLPNSRLSQRGSGKHDRSLLRCASLQATVARPQAAPSSLPLVRGRAWGEALVQAHHRSRALALTVTPTRRCFSKWSLSRTTNTRSKPISNRKSTGTPGTHWRMGTSGKTRSVGVRRTSRGPNSARVVSLFGVSGLPLLPTLGWFVSALGALRPSTRFAAGVGTRRRRIKSAEARVLRREIEQRCGSALSRSVERYGGSGTCVNTERRVVSPSPSCPVSFLPVQKTLADWSRAQE